MLNLMQVSKELPITRTTIYSWLKEPTIKKVLRVKEKIIFDRKLVAFDEKVIAIWKKHLRKDSKSGPKLNLALLQNIEKELTQAGL